MKRYEHQDPFIAETLNEYKDIIDSKKPDQLSLSTYRVDKPWGYEIWMEVNEYYVYKLIHFNAGNRSSLQSHDIKHESIYVIEGEAEVILENDEGILESKIYPAGTGWTVPRNKKHRLTANVDVTILETSSAHLNDVIRYEDDLNRNSGKLTNEHGA